MPDPVRLLATLRRAIVLTRDTPGRTGRLVTLGDAADVLVAGDLHGHVGNFQVLLRNADLKGHLRRHLVLQEVIHSPYRYPQGGDKSHQLLDLYAALKCQFPERVHLVMGNHELAQWTGRQIIKDDEDFNELFSDGVRQAYGPHADEVYAAYLELFGILPLALRTPNRCFISHSVPSAKYLHDFKLTVLAADNVPSEAFLPKGPLYGLVWGRDTTLPHVEAFLRKVDADWLISGHIQCDEGFTIPNDRQIILDAAGAPAAYCLFPADRPLSREEQLGCIRLI